MAKANLVDGVIRNAVLSPCGDYRYALRRQWADGPCVAFLMFNPSTADARQDDATIRKLRGFSERWGYGRFVVINLFAIRGRDPRIVLRSVDPVGPLTNYWMERALEPARELICAWGCSAHLRGWEHRPAYVLNKIRASYDNLPFRCLGVSRDGSPRHPLMLPYSTEREPYPVKVVR